MRVCKLIPHGWPCTLEECPPGPFAYLFGGDHRCFGFKSEYQMEDPNPHRPMAFNEAGEFFVPQADEFNVQPLEIYWEEA